MTERLIQFIYLDIDTGFYPGVHHGLAALCGAVRAAGHRAALLHMTRPLPPEAILQAVAPDADVYAFSAMTNQFPFMQDYAPFLAEATGRPILAGGVHATLSPDAVLQTPGVTWACQGEADVTVPALLNAMADSDACTPFDPDRHRALFDRRTCISQSERTLGGLWYHSSSGSICHNHLQSLPPLEELPDPDYGDFDMPRIVHDLGGRLSVVVSRGCPFHCSFCCNDALRSVYPDGGEYVRRRPPGDASRLVGTLVGRYGPTSLRFEDDLLLINQRWREEFFSLYAREIALPFECNCRADMVTSELAELLRSSGCVSVGIGIESGDPVIRNDLMAKNISDAQIESAFARLHEARLKTYAYNILGLPLETEESARKTLELNRRVRPSAGSVFYFYPYPGTKLRQLAEAKGLLRDDLEARRSYTEAPAIRPTHCSEAALRRISRRLRGFLLLQRFESFFPLPAWLKRPIRMIAEAAITCCPALVDSLTADSGLKRWLRMLSFRVKP